MSEPLVSLHRGEDTTVLTLRGNSRADAARLLLEQLRQTEIMQPVVVDWEQAEHVDTCVLQVLLALQKQLALGGLSLGIARDNPAVREYLQLAGLSGNFPPSSAPAPSPQGGG